VAGVSIVALLNSATALNPDNLRNDLAIIQNNSLMPIASQPPLSVETLLVDWLSFCESSDNPDIVVWDNGSYSWGRFMYKLPTLKMYAQKFGYLGDDLEEEDLVNWALDGDFTYRLTRRIISEGGEHNWFNCHKAFQNDHRYYSWLNARLEGS
jgi:hypothetical protein